MLLFNFIKKNDVDELIFLLLLITEQSTVAKVIGCITIHYII